MGYTALLPEFKKDLNYFAEYLHTTNGVYIIHVNDKNQVQLFVDTCNMGAGAMVGSEAYHTEFPENINMPLRSP